MGPFGKPPTAPSKGGTSGKASSPLPGHNGPSHGAEAKKKPTGKNAAKANSAEGGKAFGSPTTMNGAPNSGFETSGGGDRWSYGHSSESSAPAEWSSGSHETWQGGSVWERDSWHGKNERGNEW